MAREQTACSQHDTAARTMVSPDISSPDKTYCLHDYIRLVSDKPAAAGYERCADVPSYYLPPGLDKRYTFDRTVFLHKEIKTEENARFANLPMPFVPPQRCLESMRNLAWWLREFMGPARQDLFLYKKKGTFTKVYKWLYTVADMYYPRIWYSYKNQRGQDVWEIVVPITCYGMYLKDDFVALFKYAQDDQGYAVGIIEIVYCLVHDRVTRDKQGRVHDNAISQSRWAFLCEEIRNREEVNAETLNKLDKVGHEVPVLYRSSERPEDVGIVAFKGIWADKTFFGLVLMRGDNIPHRQLDLLGLAYYSRLGPLVDLRGAFHYADWKCIASIIKNGLGIPGKRPPQFTTDVASRTMVR